MNSDSCSLWCSVRGPILLITLGSLFAVDHFGPYSFSRTWPVLIIVLGLLKLLERLFAGKPGQAAPQGGIQS